MADIIRLRIARTAAGTSLIALGLGLAASPAMAQDASTQETVGLEEIIVQARKVDENLQDVPVAITAFSGDALEQQNAARITDIARFTPGLVFREANSSPSANSITLRGQVQTDILATLDPSVGTYVDGVYWSRAYGLNAELLDVSSAQVLKGPQGTLFGRNTTGGAILLNSNNPDLDSFSGRISGTYGRFDELTATGILNVPIVKGKLALRLAGQRASRDGWVTNTLTGVKYNERDRWNGRAKLLWQATDNFSILVSGEYFKQNEDNPYRHLALPLAPFNDPSAIALGFPASSSPYTTSGNASVFTGISLGNSAATAFTPGFNALTAIAAAQAGNPNSATMNVSPHVRAKTQTYGVTASLDTIFGNIKFIGGYRNVKANTLLDLDGTQYAIHTTNGFQDLTQYSGEMQITGKAFDNALDFAVGGFAFREKGSDRSTSVSLPTLNPNTSLFSGNIDNDSIGVYGQGTWHFTDQFSFTGGLRYSVDDKGLSTRNGNLNRNTNTLLCSITGVSVPNAGIQFPDACLVRRRDSFSGWSYTAGLEYKPTDDTLLYVKTSKGFRSGGQNLRAPSRGAFIPFLPETAYSYEAGLKAEFLDNRLRFNLAGYLTDVKNIQRTTFVTVILGGVATNATILGNAGKARFKGIEAELTARLFDGFTLAATGGITDPKYIQYRDAASGLDRRSERFTSVPKYTFSLAGNYDRDFDWGRLRARVDYSWQSKSATDPYFDADNPQNAAIVAATTEPARGLLGARLGVSFDDDRYEVAVFGRNITNNRDTVVGLVVAPLGYVDSMQREPATYGITGTVKF